MYVAFTAPHWPLHAWEEDITKYEGKYRKGWSETRMNRYEEMRGKVLDSKKGKYIIVCITQSISLNDSLEYKTPEPQ